MSDIAVSRAPAGGGGPGQRRRRGWHRLFLGVTEGFAAVQRYWRLAALSDDALARRELMRDDLPCVAVFGRHRPR
jgi:hypothetical protein